MSPKIVQKEQKRKEISYAALVFLYENGIRNFSISSLIKFMNIGKSSLYHYFESKEEILYEIYSLILFDYINDAELKLKKCNTLKEKIHVLCYFYLVNSEKNIWFRKVYLECLQTFSPSYTKKMKEQNNILMTNVQALYKKIFEEEIEKRNIKPESIHLVDAMITTADGMLLYSFSIDKFNLSKELEKYIDAVILLIEIKGDKK